MSFSRLSAATEKKRAFINLVWPKVDVIQPQVSKVDQVPRMGSKLGVWTYKARTPVSQKTHFGSKGAIHLRHIDADNGRKECDIIG